MQEGTAPVKGASSDFVLIPVLNSKTFKSWPKHADGGEAKYVPIAAALTSSYSTDAHFAAYTSTGKARRLSTKAIDQIDGGVEMRAIVFDVDGKDHKASDEWWEQERAKVYDLLGEHPGGFVYRTRGGYRIVYLAPLPIYIRDDSDRYSWWALYRAWVNYLGRRFAIVADPGCKDWTRLFRLPQVVRDGEREEREIIGDAANIGKWHCDLTAADMANLDGVAKKKVAPAGKYSGNYRGRGRLLDAFDRRGWLGQEIEAGKVACRCPWEQSHSMGSTYDSSTVIYTADTTRGDLGWFHCSHGHCIDRDVDEVIAQFSEEEMGNAPKCGATTKSGKTCAATELHSDARCMWHSATDDAKAKRQAEQDKERGGANDNTHTTANVRVEDSEWAPPVGFVEHEVPSFPTYALPKWLREFVEAEALATQTPVDLAAMLSLSVCAAALAKKVIVRACPGWDEPVNIYSATALPPASRKSPVFRDATAPVVTWEREQAEKYRPKVIAAEQRRRLDEKRLRQLEESAIKSKVAAEQERLTLEATDLATRLATEKLTVAPRVIADDVTPEKLTSLLQAHEGRIAVMSAEGGPFEMMAGRYSKDSNFDVYLKGHAGDEIRVDRTNRASEYVHRPALTVAMTVQPEVIRGLMARPEFRGKGLLARFLWTVPRSNIGSRSINPPAVPDAVTAAYDKQIRALLSWEPGRTAEGDIRPVVLSLAPDGLAALRKFQAWLEPRLADFGELGAIQDWAGKLCGAILRIVGILGINKQFLDPSIYMNASDVEAAITIGRYLLEHARAAFALMGADTNVENAKHLLRVITERKQWTTFTERDLYQAVKGDQRFREAEALQRPLAILEQRGYIRPIGDADTSTGPGRKPSRGYEVNPHNSQNPHNSVAA